MDFRTKLLMTFTVSTLTLTGKLHHINPVVGFALSILPFILLFIEGEYIICLKGIGMISVVFLLTHFLKTSTGLLQGLFILLGLIFLNFLPGIMMFYYSIVSTELSDLVASLRHMKLPDSLLIPISVIFRFIQSTLEDMRSVKEAMKMHDLTISLVFKDPMLYLEYKLIPLMMVSVQTADDVAISAMTRGLKVGQERSTISKARLHWYDYLIMLICIGSLVYYLGGYYA